MIKKEESIIVVREEWKKLKDQVGDLGKLPSLKAVPTRINQFFHNLFSNALAFSKPGVPPVINIYSELLPEALKSKSALLKKD